MAMHLRPYQIDACGAVRKAWHEDGHSDVLLVAATGAGKTQVFLSILIEELKRGGGRALVLGHRQELIFQPVERIGQIDPDWLNSADTPRVGIIMAERNESRSQLTIATVQSLTGRSAKAKEEGRYPRIEALLAAGPIDYLVVDECHHSTAASYLIVLNELRKANPNLRHLGVTATPLRADGDGLAKVYQHVAARITIADLVKMHYLVQPRWLGISTGISLKGVATTGGDYSASDLADRFDTPTGRRIIVEAYQKYAAGRRGIAFTASVAGAHELAGAFCEAGVKAAAIDAGTPKDERARLVSAFRDGSLTMLCNVDVLTEGFDAPGASCVLMCRPTKSDSRYIQAMGRGLRPAKGTAVEGEDCVVLDFLPAETRNIVMAGDVLGLPKEVTRAAIKEQEEDEEGTVQAGFTFDGEHFDSSGTPLEIVARQLDYLQASRWQWDRRDGWMTLGLGPGADGIDRTLAIVPTGEGHTLYGLRREPLTAGDEKPRYGKWYVMFQRSGDLDYLCTIAEKQADRYAVECLSQKGRSWHKKPASDSQIKYLRRLMPKGQKVPGYITAGEAGSLISYWQVRNALIDVAI